MPELDHQNLSDKQLKYAYWYLLHKKQLKRILIIVLIVIDVLLIVWALYGLVSYLTARNDFDNVAYNQSSLVSWDEYHQQHQPNNLQIGTVRVVGSQTDKSDIGVQITNPNQEWGISQMSYHFLLAGGKTTPQQTTHFLPAQTKYLLELNVNTVGRSAQLQVSDIQWRKVTPAKPLPELDFRLEDYTYTPASQLTELDQGGVLNWTVRNNSIYNFWDVGFELILLSGQREVGFNYLITPSFDSLQTQELSVSWNHQLPRVTSVEIIPDVNLFDQSVIKD